MHEWARINSSPWNTIPEIREAITPAEKVFVHDTTLRDGEQFAGVVFNYEDKIRIGQALSEMGVHRIELMPAVTSDDFKATQKLASLGLKSEIVGFCRSVKDDVIKAYDAGCCRVELEIPSNPLILRAFDWTTEQAVGRFSEAAFLAKEKGMGVTAFFMLLTLSQPEFCESFIKKILGATPVVDAVAVPDTTATCLPQTIFHLVKMAGIWSGRPVEVHTHNHYNLGAAGALAGVMAGASVVHGSINGLGEGGGNAPLEAIILDLELMLGLELGLDLSKLYSVCQLVAERSGVLLQSNWPLSGSMVFNVESGIAIDANIKIAAAGLSNPPEMDIARLIGRKRGLIVGKMSGTSSIILKCQELGLKKPDEEGIKKLLGIVKDTSISLHRGLNDQEFGDLYRQI